MTDRVLLAEEFLREAVLRSRDLQAGLHAIRSLAASDLGSCGLGEKAAFALDLSVRGQELLEQLFDPIAVELEASRIRGATKAWVERQDALDRKRNHFLKEFRGRHGFERASYAPGVLAEFEAGLARIASEEDAERRRAAESLLAREA